uniref:Uncharacterized protein n=1 Tax=Kwoniella bestiolae CBS 10118 TaxID=1296100 RepID=A0A1B9FUH9_9TREE|nr:hypothetical protein I302_08064 [Kwoniella bestiolae CBS 10118]OCF22416.1 hypothetical protein I302_08064 [Kwoniella bestiolae CBS 10118]
MLCFKSITLLTTLLGTSLSQVAAGNDLKITWDATESKLFDSVRPDVSLSDNGEFHDLISSNKTFYWRFKEGLGTTLQDDLEVVVEEDYEGTAEFQLIVGQPYIKVIDDRDGRANLHYKRFGPIVTDDNNSDETSASDTEDPYMDY